jgi:hypothetical protein
MIITDDSHFVFKAAAARHPIQAQGGTMEKQLKRVRELAGRSVPNLSEVGKELSQEMLRAVWGGGRSAARMIIM